MINAIYILTILIISLFLRNSLKQICENDLYFATLRKKRIKGKVLLKKVEKSVGFKGKTIVDLELKGIGSTPDFKIKNSNFQDEHFYDLIEIHSIINHHEVNSEIDVLWVKQYRFSKEYAFVEIDNVSLIGKKANLGYWIKFWIITGILIIPSSIFLLGILYFFMHLP